MPAFDQNDPSWRQKLGVFAAADPSNFAAFMGHLIVATPMPWAQFANAYSWAEHSSHFFEPIEFGTFEVETFPGLAHNLVCKVYAQVDTDTRIVRLGVFHEPSYLR